MDDEEEAESFASRLKGFFHRHEDEDEEDEATPGPKARQVKPIPKEKILRRHRGKSGGRPRPSVRRTASSRSGRGSDGESL